MRTRNLKTALFHVGISLVCLIWVFNGVDLGKLIDDIGSFSLWRLFSVLILAISLLPAPAMRLFVLTDFQCGLRGAFEAQVLNLGVNMLLPLKLGEAAKIVHLRNTSSLAWTALLGRVFWERFLDLNVLLIMAMLVSFFALPGTTGYFVGALTMTVWVALLLIKMKPNWPVYIARHLPGRRLRRFCLESLAHFQQTFRMTFIGRLVACTLLVWLIYSGATSVAVMRLGLPLTLLQALVFFVVTAGALAVPSAPGSVGVYEAAAVAVCTFYGIPKEQALAAAITLHMLIIFPGLIGTLILLAQGRFRLADARNKTPEPNGV